jgi:hypothetical protein
VRNEQPVEARLINHHLCNVTYSTSAHGVPMEHFGNLGSTNQNNNDNNEHTLGAEGVERHSGGEKQGALMGSITTIY